MKSRCLPLFAVLLLIGAIALACGSSTPRLAQSLTVTPATADASSYPNGQVPFTATAYYTTKPSPVSPVTATWGACLQSAATKDVTVSANGVAHCAAGAAGSYTVWAYVMSGAQVCPLYLTECGGDGCQVTGTAQITCP